MNSIGLLQPNLLIYNRLYHKTGHIFDYCGSRDTDIFKICVSGNLLNIKGLS